jgi:PAS domain S-box-containing protein
MTLSPSTLEAGLQSHRLHSHASSALTSIAASLLVLAVVASLVVESGAPPLLWAWVGCVLAALALRVGVWWAHRRSQPAAALQDAADSALPLPDEPDTTRGASEGAWLTRYRMAYAVHGLAWAMGAVWLPTLLDPEHQNLLLFALTALCTGALLTSAFDLRAALLFAVPLVVPLVLQMLSGPWPAGSAMNQVLLLFLVVVAAAAWRAGGHIRHSVRLQLKQRQARVQAERHAQAAESARQALAEQHHLLEQLLQSTPQGFWFLDTEGRTTQVNPAMCELLGRTREQVVDRNVLEFFEGEDLEVLQQELQARRRGARGAYEIGLARPDGTRRFCMNQATPIFDTQGRPLGSVGLWTDISARRQAEEDLLTYKLVANSITDLVSVIDENQVYRMVNNAWCRATGVPRAKALGRRTLDVLPEAGDTLRLLALQECIDRREMRTARAYTRVPGLADRMLETSYYPYADGGAGLRCVVMVTRDVTNEEASRQALAASAEYLRRTLNATGDAIFASDAGSADEPVRFVNDQMLRMWGIPEHLADSLTPAQIMACALPQMAEPEVQRALVAQIVAGNQRHEGHVALRDGRLLLRRCEPATVDGRPLRVWSFRDITAETQAMQRLQAAEAEHRAKLDAFPGYIGCTDERLVLRFANGRLAALLGGTPETVVGHEAAELLGAEDAARLLALAQRALAGETVSFEHRQRGRPGVPESWMQITLARGTVPHTGLPGVYGFGIDISDRKRVEHALRASEAELRALLDAFPGYIGALDQDLRYTFVNQRLLPLLGRPVDELLGRSMREVLPEPMLAVIEDELQRAAAGEHVVSQREYLHPQTGQPLYLEITHVAGPQRPDGRRTFYGFGLDVTARRQAEAALIQARDEAQGASRAKTEFLSQMSHELRTPMNAIIGFGQLLETDPDHPLLGEQQAYVQQILRSGRYLLNLINEVLDLGRIEAGRMEVDQAVVPVHDVLETCLNMVRPLAMERAIELPDPARIDCPHRVLADRLRTKQVLLNLLTNAIKYNRDGGRVSVDCRVDGDSCSSRLATRAGA